MRYFIALLLVASLQTAVAQLAPKPNIILILTDDQGFADLGAYDGKVRTPHLDALAKNGLKFTDFYAAANVCTPSRAGILTGCYPERIGMSKVFFPSQGPAYAAGKDTMGIHPDEETLAELLQKNGYATACAGKWHLGHQPPFLPLQQGFDEFYGIPYSHDMYPGTDAAYPALPLYVNNAISKETPSINQLTSLFTSFAVDFIKRQKKDPFFLYLAYSMPHVPLAVSESYAGKSGMGLYGDVLYELDASIGKIMETLKQKNMEDNTIVLFSSDNGPWTVFGNHAGSAGPFREGKGTSFDGGHHVPLLIQWKNTVPAGGICKEPLAAVDLLPTLLKITGAKLPVKKIDGHDFSYLLKNPAKPTNWPIYFYSGQQLDAVRMGDYKYHQMHAYDSLVKPGADGKKGILKKVMQQAALYNLRTDPAEQKNLLLLQPAIADSLKRIFAEHEADIKQNKRAAGAANRVAAVSANRKLIWADEFNGTKLDEKYWNILHQKRRKDPDGKDALWHKENSYLNKTGQLVIRTSKTDSGYAGACVTTKGKFERKFGYYETRVKLQKEEGHWGAFWLFGNSVNKVGNEGRDGTEIDIFESAWLGKGLDQVQAALHYDGYGADHKKANQYIKGMGLNDGGWHSFGVEWTETVYRFYCDDMLIWETDFGGVCQVPLHIMFSDEVGLWNGKMDIRKATLPDYLLVDYVRVYDKR